MKLVNLTQHVVNIVDPLGLKNMDIPPSGVEARVALTQKHIGYANPEGSQVPISLFTVEKGAVEGLPDPEEGVIYIVSALVREGVPDRKDVASPGEQVRDKDKKPCGCKSLILNG